RDQRVGGLLHAVVNKLVGAHDAVDQLLTQRLGESGVYLFLGYLQNDRQDPHVFDIAEASKLSQRGLRVEGPPRNLSRQKLDDIIRVSFGVDASHVPGPSPPLVIEDQEALVREHVEKLDHEERVAVCLRMHQLCERTSLLRIASEGVRDKASEI